MDLRIDKKYYFKKWVLDVFLDVQNFYNQITELSPYLNVVRDANGNPVVDPNDNTRYVLKKLKNTTGTIIPSIGVIVEI
jgi:hypothetical protein